MQGDEPIMSFKNCNDLLDVKKNIIVSVIIPTHNGDKFLDRAIKSVLGQTFNKIELIVVDDNGEGTEAQKKTEEVVKKFVVDKRIKYITYKNNINASHARNVGIESARGEYIALLDDDDEMLPDKIKKQVYCMMNNDESYAACYTDYKIYRGTYIEVSKECLEGQPYLEALSRNLYICGGSNLFVRKSVLKEIGGFDETFKRNQDVELLARIIEKYKIAHVEGYQLIVHMEERKNERKGTAYDSCVEIDKYYLDKFKDKIQELSLDDQRRLYCYFALERFKRSIGTKYIIDALVNLKKTHVGMSLLSRYILYLVKRRYKKEIYGFRMKNK